jgi:hypothetical protein
VLIAFNLLEDLL